MLLGMQEKNKKLLLNLIILFSIAFFIAILFVPITSVNYSDVLEKNGYENPNLYWKYEQALLLRKYSVYNKDDNPSEYHRYSDELNLFSFEIGDKTLSDSFTEFSFYRSYFSNRDNPFSMFLSGILSILFVVFGIAFFSYFCYNGFKSINVKKSNYFLYLGILYIVAFTFYCIISYYFYDFMDVKNLGYTDVFTFEYGFYINIAIIILFFIAFFIQQYFLVFPDEKIN